MNHIARSVILGIAIFFSAQAAFAEIGECNNLPAAVTAAEPQMVGCLPPQSSLQPPCDRAQLDVKQFFNIEAILPAAEPGQIYYEGKIRARGAPAGTRRFVFLYGEGQVLEQYYTDDHYQTFCIL